MLRALELIVRYIPNLSYKNLVIILIFPLTIALYYKIFLSNKVPNLILWSWHRSDDLLFIDNNTAVASLIATIYIDLDKIKLYQEQILLQPQLIVLLFQFFV
ncbi:MAG: hypothetical protein LBE72_02275 [Rickettsia sp.]|jgi:hypothetical protein|nr:hypothetical protein [Rickettsia sp.]